MRLYAPKYYLDFKCTADKCSHSCCAGWEIDVDEAAIELYQNLDGEYSKEIIKSIDFSDTPHFILGKGDRCPHLDEKGLCRIILSYGEGCLCSICREHPRFYNDTPYGKEVGLGMACEEACRIILTSSNYDQIEELCYSDAETEFTGFDSVLERTHIYSMLKNHSVPYEERLQSIYKEYGISLLLHSDNEWRGIIEALEYLDESHKELFLNYSSAPLTSKCAETYLERALAYFIYRHCSESYGYEDFIARLGFCLFCERLLCSVLTSANAKTEYEIINCARIISEEIEYSFENTNTIMLEF